MSRTAVAQNSQIQTWKYMSVIIAQLINIVTEEDKKTNKKIVFPPFEYKEVSFYNESVLDYLKDALTLPNGTLNEKALDDLKNGLSDELAYNICSPGMAERWEHELSNNMISFLSVSIIDIVEEAKDESDTPKGKLFCFYIYKGKDITKCTSKLEQLRDGIVKGKLPLNNLKTMAKVQVSKSNEAIDSNTNNKQYLLSVLRGVTREEYEAMEPLLTDSHSVVIGQDPDTFDIYMTEQSEEQISEVMKTAFVITTGNTYDKFKAFSMNKEARIKASIVRALDKRSSTILYNKTNPREFINVNANGIKYYITCEHNGQIVNVEIPELSASRSEMGEKEFEQATFDIASSFDEIGILDANKENTEHTLPEIQQKGINYQPISENIIKVQKYKTQLLKR